MRAGSKAFTLIELLIVVAIIAILAAIAVPNLLEAQTRSKVARTVADMRTIVFAYQAYRTDNQWLPTIHSDGEMGFIWYRAMNGREEGVGRVLTTPIAYIANKVPWDIFNTKAYRREWVHSGVFLVDSASVMVRSRPSTIRDWGTKNDWSWNVDGKRKIWYNWFIASTGPDKIPWGIDPQNTPAQEYYDPTNGTVSNGDITYVDTVGWIGSIGKR